MVVDFRHVCPLIAFLFQQMTVHRGNITRAPERLPGRLPMGYIQSATATKEAYSRRVQWVIAICEYCVKPGENTLAASDISVV